VNFENLFQAIQEVQVLVVGDIMVDKYINGSVSRISPEAPVPVLLQSEGNTVLGGAGNVAANIAVLGAKVSLFGLIGKDASGECVISKTQEYGINNDGLFSCDKYKTTTKTRIVAAGQQIVRIDDEEVLKTDDASNNEILASIEASIHAASIVVLSDYNKGLFSNDLASKIIQLAKAHDVPIVVDPKSSDFSRYTGADVITPNRSELSDATGNKTNTDQEIETAGRQLIDQFSFDQVLATRSEQGLSIIKKNDIAHFPTRARQVFDVSGAGDTVISAYSIATATGLTSTEAALFANAAAAVSVSKRGTSVVTFHEVKAELLRQGSIFKSESTVVDWDSAHAQTTAWQKSGEQVGFTNGCFDILHYGHVSLLERAKNHCDRLIVGLNNDNSVTRLKGPDRPINTEMDRTAVIAALRCVDMVVLFEDDTPLELITHLQPDVLFKGADYSIEQVVGRDIVEGRGGRVVLLELEHGRSTTNVAKNLSDAN